MKTLAIIIRCHGTVPIFFSYGDPFQTIMDNMVRHHELIPFAPFNIANLYIVSLAKLAGFCYGSSNVPKYVTEINKLKHTLRNKNVYTTDELVHYLFNSLNNQIQSVKELNANLFGMSYSPEITRMSNGYTLNKIYSGDASMNHLGIYYLSSNGFTGQEITSIKQKLANLTTFIITNVPNHYIRKSDIFHELAEYHIDSLYFIDLTCNVFANTNEQSPILQEGAVNWLNDVFYNEHLKGGNKKRYKKSNRKSNCHNKSKKNKYLK